MNTDGQTLTLQLSKSVVEGSLENRIDHYVTLTIYTPDGDIFKSEQVAVDDDFQYLFNLPVDLRFLGEWKIIAQFEKDGENDAASELFNVQNPYDDKMPLRISDIEYKKALGQTVSIVQAHKPIMVSVSVSNYAPFDQPFNTILEILDSTDRVVLLSFQTTNLPGQDSKEYGFSWTPDTKGNYLIKVFTIKSLDEPVILSDGSSVDLIVV